MNEAAAGTKTAETVTQPPTGQVAGSALSKVVAPLKFSLADGQPARNLPSPAKMAADSPELQPLLKTHALDVPPIGLPVTAAQLYLEQLKSLRALLKGAPDADRQGFLKHLVAVQKDANAVLEGNLKKVLAAQRPLETTWRGLAAFYEIARFNPEAKVPVQVWPVSPEKVATDDNEFRRFARVVPKQTRLSMKDMCGLVVIPTWLQRSATLKKFGELAQEGKALLVTGAPESQGAAEEACDGGELAGIKGTERWKQHVTVIGNALCVRQAHPKLEEDLGDVYVPGSLVFAAKIIHGDDKEGMAVAQANVEHEVALKSADGSPVTLKWSLRDRAEIRKLFKESIIPLANFDTKLVFWGVQSLSSEKSWSQYTVARVREYIEKCLLHYMNQKAFMPNTQDGRDKLRDKINDFITANSSDQDTTKILKGGQVKRISIGKDAAGKEDNTTIDIELELSFKVLAEEIRLDVRAKEDDSKAWQIEKSA